MYYLLDVKKFSSQLVLVNFGYILNILFKNIAISKCGVLNFWSVYCFHSDRDFFFSLKLFLKVTIICFKMYSLLLPLKGSWFIAAFKNVL